MKENLEKVKNTLLSVVKKSYHFTAPDKVSTPYAVWYEEGRNVVYEDNRAGEASEYGVIHYFTKKEYDAVPDELFEAFTVADICIKLNSIQYEEDTGIIHYEWVWEL